MSAAKETLDGASGLIGEEEEQIDESKLSWRERRKLNKQRKAEAKKRKACLLYTSPSPRDAESSRMPSSA